MLSVNATRFFVHVMVVAGEPEEIQFRVRNELDEDVLSSDTMVAGTGVKHCLIKCKGYVRITYH